MHESIKQTLQGGKRMQFPHDFVGWITVGGTVVMILTVVFVSFLYLFKSTFKQSIEVFKLKRRTKHEIYNYIIF